MKLLKIILISILIYFVAHNITLQKENDNLNNQLINIHTIESDQKLNQLPDDLGK